MADMHTLVIGGKTYTIVDKAAQESISDLEANKADSTDIPTSMTTDDIDDVVKTTSPASADAEIASVLEVSY